MRLLPPRVRRPPQGKNGESGGGDAQPLSN